MAELKKQEQEAKMTFAQKLGQLKYFDQLQKNEEMDDCPICCSPPQPKVCYSNLFLHFSFKTVNSSPIQYVMFECGHHVCNECFSTWQKATDAAGLKCLTCRRPLSKEK